MALSKFQEEITSIAYRMKRMGDEIQANLYADTLLHGIDLSDVSYVSVSRYRDDGPVSITLNLYSDKRDSKLAHKIAQKLGVKFEKSKSWDKESLRLKTTVPENDGMPEFNIEIDGAVPKTCRIEMREIPLTEEEIEQARREALENVKLVRIEREIVCK